MKLTLLGFFLLRLFYALISNGSIGSLLGLHHVVVGKVLQILVFSFSAGQLEMLNDASSFQKIIRIQDSEYAVLDEVAYYETIYAGGR